VGDGVMATRGIFEPKYLTYKDVVLRFGYGKQHTQHF